MKHIRKFLIILTSVFLLGYFLKEAISSTDMLDDKFKDQLYYNIELISELLSVFVSFSIFALTWHAYGKSKDNQSLFLGWTFLVTGLLIMIHILSYPFMPDFITPNSEHKAATFFIESRLVLGLLLLASVYVSKETLPELINKSILLSYVIFLFALFFLSLILYKDARFAVYDLSSYSNTTVILLFITTIIILFSSYLYYKRWEENRQQNLMCLIYGSTCIVISNLVFFSYELSAHLLLIAGFYYVHLALYKSSVELPYEKLSIAEDKLRIAAEEKYRNLFDNAHDAIITCDLDDNITSWNGSAEKIFGWTVEEVKGKKLTELIIPPEIRNIHKNIIKEVISGKPVSDIDISCPHKNGNRVEASLSVSPIREAGQNVIGISCILRDITERKQIETKLTQTMAELVRSNKELEQFAYIASHDLQEPLRMVVSYLQLIERRYKSRLDPDADEFIGYAIDGASRMQKLIVDLLAYSRLGTRGKPFEPTDCETVFKLAVTNLEVAIKESGAEVTHDALPTVRADSGQLVQLFQNLIGNAIKFRDGKTPEVHFGADKKKDDWVFSVKDNGIGIDMQYAERVFGIFQRLHGREEYNGNGIGLAVCKKIVERHGGRIWFESQPREGSTFYFTIPINEVDNHE